MQLQDGSTALFLAAQEGHLQVVHFLLKIGAGINVQRKDGTSALWMACQQGRSEVVKLLLEQQADADCPRADGATPLFKAAQKGHFAICRMLLEHSPRLGLLDNGVTVLHAAVSKGRTDVSLLLCHNGADALLCDSHGQNSLDIALANNDLLLHKLLQQASAKPDSLK